jgi:hypothetical protein
MTLGIASRSSLVSVRVSIRVKAVSAAARSLVIADARIDSVANQARLSGSVRNASDHLVHRGVVGAVAVDSANVPIAALYDLVAVNDLGAGETATFRTTTPGIPEFDRETVADIRPFAFELP